jgi:hypothetical protein
MCFAEVQVRLGSGTGSWSFWVRSWYKFEFVCSQVRVQMRLRSDAGSWMFEVKFEYRYEVVLLSMRSGSLFDYGGDA